MMKRMFVAERDRQYAILQDVKKYEAKYDYLVSDNAACAGRFLCEKYDQKPHDDSNISRCRAEANKLRTTTSHHKFNSDTLHSITTGTQKNIAQLIETLKLRLKKYKSTYSIASKINASNCRRNKENRRKGRKRNTVAVEKTKE